ncbi:hypothetical protein CONPUDRAFT_83918 [Coniophora puteana RWD-64-598 SS2]|uniref:Uncharacterized protein n=1 Tax=Coniophora puteana (strain RWD-64-598) TaxID=741705 RepID=A0A5M3MHL7_CONPW|nr:uncharacterized protein CONPUDRAFT_83918 [Coniophora puteana RWD-64-598 SS2]EIW78547.1 hypothetical protein CONPUDRAFT_83918 [Coniophora puteana RWD-64-598 SS2]
MIPPSVPSAASSAWRFLSDLGSSVALLRLLPHAGLSSASHTSPIVVTALAGRLCTHYMSLRLHR